MRILLVDDEEHVLRAMMRVFRRQPQHELVGVRSAGEALEHLTATHFDAALVDHHLAGSMNGAHLLERIAERWPQMRRVLCTGGSMGVGDDLSDAHAHEVLMKPATVEELVAAVEGPAARTAVAAG
jgi:DNA-binding NarL/FixJ family response regulator